MRSKNKHSYSLLLCSSPVSQLVNLKTALMFNHHNEVDIMQTHDWFCFVSWRLTFPGARDLAGAILWALFSWHQIAFVSLFLFSCFLFLLQFLLFLHEEKWLYCTCKTRFQLLQLHTYDTLTQCTVFCFTVHQKRRVGWDKHISWHLVIP